jgi:hypothetical protein
LRNLFTPLTALVAAALWGSTAQANITFSIEPATVFAVPGDTGDSFDVVLTNSLDGSAVTIATFSFEVSVTDPDITLTGANFDTVAASYIFAGQSLDQDTSTPLNSDTGQTLDAGDQSDASGVTLDPGESLALGHVTFDVEGNAAPGIFPVTFTGGSGAVGENRLLDASFNQINIDILTAGSIDVVPEPSSLLLMLAGIAAVAAASVSSSRSHRVR